MTLRVGLAGTNFGARFLPVWQAHPRATCAAVCQRDAAALERVATRFGVPRRVSAFRDLIADDGIDAVHLCTPPQDHAEQTVDALLAGKHVLCSVPMATTWSGLARVLAARRASGRVYLLAETAVHTREYAWISARHRAGELGELQFGTGTHLQDTTRARPYWRGLSPMLYSSHLVAPLLELAAGSARAVACMSSTVGQPHDAPGYRFQSCLVDLGPGGPLLTVVRGAGRVSREWVEGFAIYGSRASFEWPRVPGEAPLLLTDAGSRSVEAPDHGAGLPPPLRMFTRPASPAGMSGGHGGAYGPIVDAFVRAVLDGEPATATADRAAEWTAVGLAAEASSQRQGEPTAVPTLEQSHHLDDDSTDARP